MVGFVFNDNIPGLEQLGGWHPLTPIYLQHLPQQGNELVAEVVVADQAVETVTLLALWAGHLAAAADIRVREQGGQGVHVLHFCAGRDEGPAQDQVAQDGPHVEHDRPGVDVLAGEYLLGGQVPEILQLHQVQLGDILADRLQMREPELGQLLVQEDVHGPDLAGVDALGAEVAGQLHQKPADLVDALLVDVGLDQVLQICGHILHHDVELVLLLDDLIDGREIDHARVLHESEVLVLEDLVPGGTPVQLLDNKHLVSCVALGSEVGTCLCFYYLFVQSILVHPNKIIQLLHSLLAIVCAALPQSRCNDLTKDVVCQIMEFPCILMSRLSFYSLENPMFIEQLVSEIFFFDCD